jgi:hypothetical protein
MKYTAYLIRPMSQMVEFEAPEDATPEELAALAMDLDELEPNISNPYDGDGETQIHYLRDEKGRNRYSQTGEPEGTDSDAAADN